MIRKFAWKDEAICKNAHLTRVAPINNLCNNVSKPVRVIRKVLLFGVDWLCILPIQEADECSLDLRIATGTGTERNWSNPRLLTCESSERSSTSNFAWLALRAEVCLPETAVTVADAAMMTPVSFGLNSAAAGRNEDSYLHDCAAELAVVKR
jgi:hypothetical protein